MKKTNPGDRSDSPRSSAGGAIIEIRSLDFSYDLSTPVLEGVNLTVPAGEFASIVGPNGGGKTTLVRLILGLLRPNRGTVSLFGRRPERSRFLVGYTPQQVHVDRLFPISVLDVVLTGRLGVEETAKKYPDGNQKTNKETNFNKKGEKESRWNRFAPRLFFRYGRDDRNRAMEALREMGLESLAAKSFGELSGGQRQRVLIARALCPNPRLLILDEPTNNMDPASTEIFYRLLENLNRRTAILIVSHDLGVVSQYVQSVICVNRKVIVHPTSELDGRAVREIYGSGARLIRHDHRCSEEGHIHLKVDF